MTQVERQRIRAAAVERAAVLRETHPLTEEKQRKLRVLIGSDRAA